MTSHPTRAARLWSRWSAAGALGAALVAAAPAHAGDILGIGVSSPGSVFHSSGAAMAIVANEEGDLPMTVQAFASPKGAIASLPTPNGKSRIIFRVADIVAAAEPSDEETAALNADLAGQLRIDLLDQYVGGLRTHFGFTVNEQLLKETITAGRQGDAG